MRKIISLVILVVLIAFCAGTVRIGTIKERPRKFHNQQVTITGYVEKVITLPILGVGIYQLDDGTGKIWVKPAGEAPYKGDRVTVAGTIKVGLTISGRTFGLILLEQGSEYQ